MHADDENKLHQEGSPATKALLSLVTNSCCGQISKNCHDADYGSSSSPPPTMFLEILLRVHSYNSEA